MEDKRKDYQSFSVPYCLLQLCTVIYAHAYEQFLQLTLGLGLRSAFCTLFN